MVFFQELLIHNTFDVMHCEKNLCKNVVKTIFGNKDTMAIREDFKDCGIWSHLWLQTALNGFIKPIASYVLSNEEKNIFLQILFTLKTPIGYVSNLKFWV
jgi:hypothetical protein